jgi:glycosyltransferase involved in cell wall biosynthesis
MTQPHKFVVWQPVLTSHQAYTLQALGRAADATVTAFVADAQDDIRAAQGWTPVSASALKIDLIVIPKSGWFAYARRQLLSHRDAVHIFGSPFDRPKLMTVLALAALHRLRFYLISEPYSPIASGYLDDDSRLWSLLRSWLRPAIYRLYGLMLRRRVSGVFAISPLAISQYRAMGIAPDKIFPFGYFVSAAQQLPAAPAASEHRGQTLQVICIASLIARKGLGSLIGAVKSLRGQQVRIQLEIFGPGNASDFEFDNEGVIYRGVIPFGHAQEYIARYDLLVLPSDYDGWGVVVNEALMAGVPVVCSDRVGAGAVAKKWGCGLVYPSADRSALGRTLLAITRDPAQLQQMRLAAAPAAGVLTPQIAGEYMLQAVLSAERPELRPACPWYDPPAG